MGFVKTAEAESVEVVETTLTKKAGRVRGFSDLDERQDSEIRTDAKPQTV